jgi:hypothetical protein
MFENFTRRKMGKTAIIVTMLLHLRGQRIKTLIT